MIDNLASAYNKINTPQLLVSLYNKFKEVDKKNVKEGTPIEQCILKKIRSPDYIITITDIIMYMNKYNIPIILWIGKQGVRHGKSKFTYFKFRNKTKNTDEECNSFPYTYMLVIKNNTVLLLYNRKTKVKFYEDDLTQKINVNKTLSDYLESPQFESFETMII